MKEIDELNNRIGSNEEIVNSLIKKIDELEKRDAKSTDYTLHFEALKKIFEVFLLRYNIENAELKAAISQLNISYPAEQIQSALTEVKSILEAVRKSLPVKVNHQLDPNTKGLIIAATILLMVTAISVGLCGYLWTENSRMQTNDIKFRAIRQVYPIQANWADRYYAEYPDAMKDTTERLENEALERSQSNDLSNQKSREAKKIVKHSKWKTKN